MPIIFISLSLTFDDWFFNHQMWGDQVYLMIVLFGVIIFFNGIIVAIEGIEGDIEFLVVYYFAGLCLSILLTKGIPVRLNVSFEISSIMSTCFFYFAILATGFAGKRCKNSPWNNQKLATVIIFSLGLICFFPWYVWKIFGSGMVYYLCVAVTVILAFVVYFCKIKKLHHRGHEENPDGDAAIVIDDPDYARRVKIFYILAIFLFVAGFLADELVWVALFLQHLLPLVL